MANIFRPLRFISRFNIRKFSTKQIESYSNASTMAFKHANYMYNDDETAIIESLKEQKKHQLKYQKDVYNTADDDYFTEYALKHSKCEYK